MGRINRELEGMLDTTEKFLKIFERVVPMDFLELHTISQGLIARLESRSERIVSDLSQMAVEVISIAACAQINLGLDKTPDAEASELLSKLCLLITTAEAASQMAEDLGVETGSLFAYFKVISSGRELLEGLDGSEVAVDRVTSLIDVFGIMDPTADDWPQLIPHINDYFSECEAELSRLSAVSQSCDLMRQILEHRIREAVLIKSYVDNFSGDIALPENLSMLKVELFDLIVKKMVTDQEKFAALFYLNLSSKVEDESSATPGDMLLF
jgi:hypothetical protein